MSIGFLDFGIIKSGFLDFGRSGGENDSELTIEETLSPLTSHFSFLVGFRLFHFASIPWQTTDPARRAVSVASSSASFQMDTGSVAWGDAQPVSHAPSIIWESMDRSAQTVAIPWVASAIMQHTDAVRWMIGEPISPVVSIPWDTGLVHRLTTAVRWMIGEPIRSTVASPWQTGDPIRWTVASPWDAGRVEPHVVKVLWDHGRPPPHGYRASIIPWPWDGKQWGRLNFACPQPATLNFGNLCFGSSRLLVPVRRSYRVINAAALIRVSDSADIPVSNLTIRLDWESWCWTLTATLIGRTAYETVPAAPGLVQATINGFVWRFVVDEVDYSRSFGTFGGQLSGRSPIALLASPYALQKSYQETSIKTAQQLTLQELPVGFTLTTALPDWTVPAGVFSYQNLTPMEAIIRITRACGGRIYADQETQDIYATHKWPRKPWDWTSAPADVTLPSSYTLTEQLRRQEGFEYEAVMVSGGVDNGIIAICKRTGTGGLTHAPSAVDTLITHLDAAESRAIQELADHWPMKFYTLDLPLQAAPAGAGLIDVGTVVDFADGVDDGFRGLVVGVSVTANWNSVQQTLELIAP